MTRFTHILFDLDETLYPRGVGLLQEVNRRIRLWLERSLGLTAEEADAQREAYFRQYGTTLTGLLAERQVDADAYLTFVHDVDVTQYVTPNPALRAMLASILLRRVVFTNGPSAYARRVLRALSVDDLFDQVLGIQEMDLKSKPQPAAYRRLLQLLEVKAAACILVEDRAANLRLAKKMGMTTVLVDAEAGEGVDFVVADVLDVGALVARLLDSAT